MSDPLSKVTDSPSAPNEDQSLIIIDERGRIWLADNDVARHCLQVVGAKVRTMLGSECLYDVEKLTLAVLEEFQNELRKGKEVPPTGKRLDAYLRRKAFWRADSYLDSKDRWSKHNTRLYQIGEDGKEYDLEISDPEAEEAYLSIEKNLDNCEIKALVEQALDRLTPLQRVCITMQLQDDMQPREIAAVLGISSAKVSEHARHGRTKIATFFKKNHMEKLWKT